MIDPLKQFYIKNLFNIPLGGGVEIPFTNQALAMVVAIAIVFLIFFFAIRPPKEGVPNRLQMMVELTYQFIAYLVQSNVGQAGQSFFPYILSLFLFVFMGNLVGLFPYTYTFTSQLITTFALACVVFLVTVVVGLVKHGFHFFSFFLPKGTPLFVAPLLVPVELLSFLSRPISLSVRLFANMVAGHAVLKIFSGFVVVLTGTMLTPLAVLPFAVNILVTGFEFFVCFLQACVFSILSCIYLNDMLSLH